MGITRRISAVFIFLLCLLYAGGAQAVITLSPTEIKANSIITKGPWVDVRAYGAKGDGSTDDTTAIQTAINTGKRVYFPGTSSYYKITAALTLSSNSWLVGDGVRSQIRQVTANANVISGTSVNDVVVTGLYLYGPGDGSADSNGNGIYLASSSRARIENNKFENIGNTGVHLKDSTYSHIVDNTMVSFVHYRQDAADIAIKYASSYNTVRGNKCISGTGTGILVQAIAAGDSANFNTVEGNLVTAHDRYGIVLYATNGPSSTNVIGNKVIGNTVKDISDVTATYYGAGIYAQGTKKTVISGNIVQNTNTGATLDSLAPGAIGVTDSSHVTVTGNAVENAQWYGITVRDPGAVGGHYTVTGNTISASVKAGIYGIAASNLIISGNTVSGGSSYGIYLYTVSANKYAVVSNNTVISNALAGVYVVGYSDVSIKNNMAISNGTHGVAIQDVAEVDIEGNHAISNTTWGIAIGTGNTFVRVKGNTSKTNSAYGIHRDTGSASVMFFDNRVTGNTTANYSNGPFVDLPANDTTPTVAGNSMVATANTAPTTITMFDDGVTGQEILVYVNDAFTTIDFTATNIKGNAGADFAASAGDTLRCTFKVNWYCDVETNI